jgi:ABC-type proline/glycine betaine transport system ATPase subunit
MVEQTTSDQMEVDANVLEFKKFKISDDAPTVLIVMGMAGSGKTTFVKVSETFY